MIDEIFPRLDVRLMKRINCEDSGGSQQHSNAPDMHISWHILKQKVSFERQGPKLQNWFDFAYFLSYAVQIGSFNGSNFRRQEILIVLSPP